MSDIPSRQDWDFSNKRFKYGDSKLDKDAIYDSYVRYFLDVLSEMFVYEGLPETIDPKYHEQYLLTRGYDFITLANDNNYYAFFGGFGGEPNAYYQPTEFIVSNPYLGFNKVCKVGMDGVLFKNSSTYASVFPVIEKYAKLLTECDVSFNLGIINTRFLSLINATNDRAYQSALTFLKGLVDGELGVIASDDFNQSIITQPVESSSSATNLNALIELRQYIISAFFTQFGVKSAYNMKRERLNEAEVALGEDSLYPNIDDMLYCRKKAIEELNKLFGFNATVEFNSSWRTLDYERDMEENSLLDQEDSSSSDTGTNSRESEDNNN